MPHVSVRNLPPSSSWCGEGDGGSGGDHLSRSPTAIVAHGKRPRAHTPNSGIKKKSVCVGVRFAKERGTVVCFYVGSRLFLLLFITLANDAYLSVFCRSLRETERRFQEQSLQRAWMAFSTSHPPSPKL